MSSRTNTKTGVGACNLQQNCSTTNVHQFKLMELQVKPSEFLFFRFLLSLQMRTRDLLWKKSKLPESQVMKHHQRIHMAVYKPAKTKTAEQLHVNSQQDTKKKTKQSRENEVWG